MDWSVAAKLATPAAATARHARLVAAAHQFEASMLSELMKPLQEDSLFAEKPDDGATGEGSGNALTGFASEALGRSLSEHGGLGIARQIIGQLDVRSSDHQRSSHPVSNHPIPEEAQGRAGIVPGAVSRKN